MSNTPLPLPSPFRRVSLLALVALVAGLQLPAARAQTVTSQPVVQPLPSQDTQRLNRALVELAKQPRNMPALIEAGDAALSVGDLNAALGFYERAREIEPDNVWASLGLAKVYLRSGRPVNALPLFEAAEEAGAELRAVRSDKALALDMVGQQTAAKIAYLQVLEASPRDDEARRRLAISYAISAENAALETTLRPLIERRDFAAFRARAFGLAILGEQDRAAAITEAVMPRELANKITPYLEFMPRLTPAQQASAANLGIFPRAAEIGRDPPEIAQLSGAAPREPAAQTRALEDASSQLEPQGAPLGREIDETPPLASAQGAVPEPLAPQSEAPEPVTPEPTQAARVSDAFSDMLAGEAPDTAVAPQDGAVDLATIEVPREEPPEPEPKEPEYPARIWVQLATGRDVTALGFDWRRFARKAPDELSGFEAHTVPWGQANRLLAGPLKSRSEARDLVNALARKGIDTFIYASPEGTQIQELATP
ncbi:MAG: tetratricopeptide repeat protein [Pseudomonadota bacterium]